MIPIAKPLIGREEENAVLEVLRSGHVVQGKKVEQLEQEFARVCCTKYAIAVSNGTTALHSALAAMGVKPGDEVITSPFTFVASASCILMQGAKVVFADIKKDTFNIDPESVINKITEETKAIVPVDLYGQAYDYDAIKKIAEKNELFILEDACQAINASLNGKMCGSLGDMAAFSLYATKNVISGEGGIVTTDNEEFAEKLRRIRNHGQFERYDYGMLGYNYRMTDIIAAIGVEQMRKLNSFTDARIKNAEFFNKELSEVEGLRLPFIKPNAKHVYHQYTIVVEDSCKVSRDELVKHLRDKGIGCGIYYPKPLHLHPMYLKMGYKEGDFPVAEEMSKRVISLPVHPGLNDNDRKKIVQEIKNICL